MFRHNNLSLYAQMISDTLSTNHFKALETTDRMALSDLPSIILTKNHEYYGHDPFSRFTIVKIDILNSQLASNTQYIFVYQFCMAYLSHCH